MLAAAPVKHGLDPFGYSAAFDLEIKNVGQIAPQQFAARYPTPQYLGKLSWDPTTAKFFDRVNAEKVKKPGGKTLGENGKEFIWPEQELPGYKLAPDELAFDAGGPGFQICPRRDRM